MKLWLNEVQIHLPTKENYQLNSTSFLYFILTENDVSKHKAKQSIKNNDLFMITTKLTMMATFQGVFSVIFNKDNKFPCRLKVCIDIIS